MATKEDIQFHYDLDNNFFRLFLDRDHRAYSCGVWKTAQTLEEAQLHKLQRMCRFAHVSDGQRVLDVGCGWGGMLEFITTRFKGSQVHGLTLSQKQLNYVQTHAPASVSVELLSWQHHKPDTPYDAIVSIGAFEHFASMEDHSKSRHRQVYAQFFDWCRTVTTNDAHVGLQSIIINRAPSSISELRDSKYLLEKVFPGSALPSLSDVQAATADKYDIREIKLIGLDYARTLSEWNERLQHHEDEVVQKYGQETFKHYCIYFDAAKRCFESGYVDLLQISLRKSRQIKILASR